MPSTPTTVFGLAAFDGERHLADALESLLTQTRDDLAVIVLDDASTDRTEEVARAYATFDRRVSYERNERTLGLVRNWRRVLELAVERFPHARHFAWASDHDVWHPRWLEALAAELEAHPEAVLAYPLAVRIDGAGAEYPGREALFDTTGVAVPGDRLRRVARTAAAPGEMIYGLFRRDALVRCGPFPLVVLPDRLYLVRLSLEGEFRQVRRRLWYRRYRPGVAMSNRRQRRAFFPDGVPLRARAPWWAAHPLLLGRSLAGRRGRTGLVAALLLESVRNAHTSRRERVGRRRRWRRREWTRRFRGLARTALERAGLREPSSVPPPARAVSSGHWARPEDSLLALERAEVLDDLARPGAAVVELGGASGLAEELYRRYPELVWERAETPEQLGDGADLAVSVGALDRLSAEAVETVVGRLHELGVPTLYSLDRETDALRQALGVHYRLHDVWLPAGAGDGRKPDPSTGPVPRAAGRYRHLVGRRRLRPELPSTRSSRGLC